MNKDYLTEVLMPLSPLRVIEEAARCLLCHDAPCSKACPAKTDPARFIRAVRFRNMKGAVEVVRENNSLAGVCARVCPTEKLCMDACSRCGIDKPIEIAQIQRYLTDYEDSLGMKVFKKGLRNKEKIAVIGSGPAGLEAAYQLCQKGYQVTIFEKQAKLGGWMRYGIPEYRLPSKVLDNEINRIIETGIDVQVNKTISKKEIQEMAMEYKAILLAIGKSEGRILEMFAGNSYAVSATEMLAQIKEETIPQFNNVLIIGGGDVAMDIAVSLKKLGSKQVVCVCRETVEEFLASKHEQELAKENNISILDGYTPMEVIDNEVLFEHMKVPSSLRFKADKIILAVGQYAKMDLFDYENAHGKMIVKNYKLNNNVFACGDIVEKDEMVVSAVKSGKEAAEAIDQYLGGRKNA